MAKKKKMIGAADLMAELMADPEWVRKHEEREAKRQAFEAQLKAEGQPIVADLRTIGLAVSSVWDLVNSSACYPAALPILLKHLRRPYHPRSREGIARALTVQEAEGIAGGPILDALRTEEMHEVRWALANALTIVADPSNADAIARLIDDPRYEDVRERLRQALKNLRPPAAR
jgi:hypothetical protein